MDKLLLSTLFAMVAGFLTAALSFVKLVNDKESRITDYRQEWTNSVRESFAKLNSCIYALSVALKEQFENLSVIENLKSSCENESNDEKKARLQDEIKFEQTRLKTTQEEIIELRKEVRHAFQFTSLHFKPGDTGFASIEHKFDAIYGHIKSISNLHDSVKIAECRGQIDIYCSELLNASKLILKDEWERIKGGEDNFKATKRIAKWGAVFLLFLVIIISAHAAIAVYKNHPAIDIEPTGKTTASVTSVTNPTPK